MPKRPDRSSVDILRLLQDIRADDAVAAFARRLDEQVFVGGKRVTRQKLPKPAKSSLSTIHQVKVTIYGSKPPVWRRLELPSAMTLDLVHETLQIAFDWQGYHLHAFETACGQFGSPDQDDDWSDRADEASVTLSQVAPAETAKIVYVYDFGDDWRHDIVVEKILPAETGIAYPRCIAGRRTAPEEDSGGVWDDAGSPEGEQFDPSEVTAALAQLSAVIVAEP
ncbi:MAG TPA: plasmid pRiA4b ORF-3 family protein [Streptosporangiaceae bacterium]|nr:plasmid pRiA4b ORF-3 family protein [Streptosporangiaceae bacterium]